MTSLLKHFLYLKFSLTRYFYKFTNLLLLKEQCLFWEIFSFTQNNGTANICLVVTCKYTCRESMYNTVTVCYMVYVNCTIVFLKFCCQVLRSSETNLFILLYVNIKVYIYSTNFEIYNLVLPTYYKIHTVF